MPHAYTSLHYHLVFATKDRAPLITPEIRPRLHAYLGGILNNEGGSLLEAGGTADHLHLLAAADQNKAVADLVRSLKANSSRWLRSTFGNIPFAWQGGYAAFTVGPGGVERVRAYLRNQEQHHRRVTFEEEFVQLLERCGIPYDERRLWG